MAVAIIVPTWNNSQCLKTTVDSLFHFTRDVDFRLIVVDNGSGAATGKYLKTKDCEVVRLEENLGFVKGVNAGLERVADGEHVCLLNDDVCIVDPLWLSKLESHLDGDVGAVGAVSNFAIGAQFMENSPEFELVHEFPFLVGFCMLIRHDAFKKVGFLDERFGMGGSDDLDYSIRLRKAGYKLLVDHTAFVFHWGSVTLKKLGGYNPDNSVLLQKKWGQREMEDLLP